jgi:hypothetical protein
MTEIPSAPAKSAAVKLRKVGDWQGIRVLAWDGDVLYGCRGYQIVCLRAGASTEWETVARFRPPWWRNLTSRAVLSYRLVRDGFHALTILGHQKNDQTMVGAVPSALVTRFPDSDEFQVTHKVQRGTRPLQLTAVPSGNIYWGEYFDNRERAEVHIYVSTDRGCKWQIAYTFAAGSVRHIHNIVYDRCGDCLWILTGDEGAECKLLRASCDLCSVEVVLAGNQQTRAVAAIPTKDALYFSTDTPFEMNHVYRLDRACRLERVGELASSSISGCSVGDALFFSTMIEPSAVNTSREVQIAGSKDGTDWQVLARWRKDKLPMRYFQYGNAFLPAGENPTRYLAATSIAVEIDDLVTTLWEVESA